MNTKKSLIPLFAAFVCESPLSVAYIFECEILCYVSHQASILCLNSCSYFKRVTSDAFIFLFWKKIILELSQVDWNNFKVFFFFSIWSWYRFALYPKLQLNSKFFERDVHAEKINKSEQRFLIFYLKNENKNLTLKPKNLASWWIIGYTFTSFEFFIVLFKVKSIGYCVIFSWCMSSHIFVFQFVCTDFDLTLIMQGSIIQAHCAM